MDPRPPDLPDFSAPPVTEVVLGVQFNSLTQLMAAHLGLIWATFKERFGEIEEHPQLDPVFETFSQSGQDMPMPGLRFPFLLTPAMPRVFFINSGRTELLQVQRDRFIHNWHKVGEGDEYPRFESMLETFMDGYRKFETVIERENLGSIVPNQCEVTYINQIPVPDRQGLFEMFEQLFGSFTRHMILEDLQRPEDARYLLRYIIRSGDGTPAGRLIVNAEPGARPDGSRIVQLALTARGKPNCADLSGVSDFMKIGRGHIVRAFTKLTSDEMHKLWGRKQ